MRCGREDPTGTKGLAYSSESSSIPLASSTKRTFRTLNFIYFCAQSIRFSFGYFFFRMVLAMGLILLAVFSGILHWVLPDKRDNPGTFSSHSTCATEVFYHVSCWDSLFLGALSRFGLWGFLHMTSMFLYPNQAVWLIHTTISLRRDLKQFVSFL